MWQPGGYGFIDDSKKKLVGLPNFCSIFFLSGLNFEYESVEKNVFQLCI